MYKIDWNSYLSEKRLRQSEGVVGTNKQKEYLDERNAFESDFGRVVFCTATRRMHDKTQVFPLTNGDCVHTRLTHSLEVMNIAASLGIGLCRHEEFIKLYGSQAPDLERKITAVLKTAAFMHDVGNPPFGHYGEETIQKYFKEGNGGIYINKDDPAYVDFSEFDGNAEGFRILTKMQYLGDLYGLNLTCAVLGAYLKYPNVGNKDEDGYVGCHKHGVLTTEKDVYEQVVEACNMRKADGNIKRHPLSFLVEAADTICYTVMDLEDGLSLGKISLQQICKWVKNKIGRDDFDLLKHIQFRDSDFEKKKNVNFRIALIQYFVTLAIKKFISNLETIDKGTYNKELLKDDDLKLAETLGKFAREELFIDSSIVTAELTGASVLNGLLDLVIDPVMKYDGKEIKDKRIFRIMSESGLKLVHHECELYHPDRGEEFRLQVEKIPGNYRLRMIVDWISGMTDGYALEMYQRLSGMVL